MLKVGLTGSIAVGKTFVLGVFRELGCHVLDADQTAREVVEPGTAGLAQIVSAFGPDILTTAGGLDRARMAAIVFADEEKRLLLNSIVHPLVFESQNKWLAECETADPRGIAIVNGTIAAAVGLGLQQWLAGLLLWAVGHSLAVFAARRDPDFAPVLLRHLRQRPSYGIYSLFFRRTNGGPDHINYLTL